jgi:deoxyribonuclease IV
MAETQHSTEPVYDPADEYRPEPPEPPRPPAWMDGSTRIGIHTSIAGHVTQSLEIARKLGANALQIFSSSPRMWIRPQAGPRIATADCKKFQDRRAELGLGPLAIHANYLINLASPEPVLHTRSVQTFHEEIARATLLGADFLVVHPGSSKGGDRRAAARRISDGLRYSVRGLKMAGGPRILLENTAGQGSCLGCQFEELKWIMDAAPDLGLGVCVDTAHLFQAGHDVRTSEGLEKTLEKIESTIGLDRVAMLHVNDSKTVLGSRSDRHEHIGKGKIGLAAFERILNHPLLTGRAFILETPIDKPGDDARNVKVLWKLAGVAVKQDRAARDGFKIKAKARGRRHARIGPARRSRTAMANRSKRRGR